MWSLLGQEIFPLITNDWSQHRAEKLKCHNQFWITNQNFWIHFHKSLLMSKLLIKICYTTALHMLNLNVMSSFWHSFYQFKTILLVSQHYHGLQNILFIHTIHHHSYHLYFCLTIRSLCSWCNLTNIGYFQNLIN